jgi:hypothetical protein
VKLLVEFESKAEMDDFFRASQQGQLEAPAAVYLLNKMPQSVGLNMKTKDDEPGAVVVELVMRGTEADQQLIPDSACKIV